jgi:5-hydroxyisourate hydrolase-like protein (transthyretin family)
MNRVVISAFVLCLLAVASLAQQKTGTLKGKVENEKGKPFAEVEVTVMRSRDRATADAKTDQSGEFSIELEPGDYTVTFSAQGYKGGTLTVMQQVEEGKETIVKTVRLQKESRTSLIRGAVFDANGHSLAGVRLKLMRIRNDDEEKVGRRLKTFTSDYVTNSRGEFAFRVTSERARYQVTATQGGFKAQTKVVDVNEDEAVPLAFSLEPVKK